MHTALKAAGIPAEISLSAGAYLCNHLMFTLLDHFATQQKQTPAGFMHLPSLPEQVLEKKPQSPSMSLEMSIRAVAVALEIIARSL
jgi:pyroglutamyl-peptidase